MNTKAQIGIMLLLLLLVVAGVAAYTYYLYSPKAMNDAATNENDQGSLIPDSGTMNEGTGSGSIDSGTTDISNIKEFTVEATSFKFTPTVIQVNKGDTVKINFVNKEGFHDFVIDEFSLARTQKLSAGGSQTIQFIADKQGTFEYYCSVGTHRQMGMVGQLTVN